MANPTYMVDPAKVIARKLEVTAADFDGGANLAASNACGIGVNMAGGAIGGEAQEFTLLDQAAAARTPQDSQVLGGTPLPLLTGAVSTTGDGTVTGIQDATLATLGAGWVGVTPV